MAGKNIAFHEKLEITSKRATRAKVMTYLTLRSRKRRSDSFELPYNRQELADYLEVERSGLSVEIGKLCREGVIEARKKRFRILKSIDVLRVLHHVVTSYYRNAPLQTWSTWPRTARPILLARYRQAYAWSMASHSGPGK